MDIDNPQESQYTFVHGMITIFYCVNLMAGAYLSLSLTKTRVKKSKIEVPSMIDRMLQIMHKVEVMFTF